MWSGSEEKWRKGGVEEKGNAWPRPPSKDLHVPHSGESIPLIASVEKC